MITQHEYSNTQLENEKLRLENAQLKEDLEKEAFLHKALYKQWNELNLRMLATEREFKQFKSARLFYKYAFYLILFAIIPVYYFSSSTTRDNKVTAVPQVVSSPAIVTTAKKDTVVQLQPPGVKHEEKSVIQPDTIQLKPVATKLTAISKPPVIINKPQVIVKPLTDSVRNLIYSQGWDAYYEKSPNPYPKSSQKYNIWLAGWKDAENDDRKNVTRAANDTGG